MNARYLTLLVAALSCSFAEGGFMLPATGVVSQGLPDANGAISVTADFGVTFDPASVDRNSYTQEFSITLGADGFDEFDAFRLTSSTGGSVLIGFGASRGHLISNPSPGLIFGNVGLTPGAHIAMSDGVAEYTLTPYAAIGGDLRTVVPSHVMDFVDVSVRLIAAPPIVLPPPPPTGDPVPEPSSMAIIGIALIGAGISRRRLFQRTT